LTKNPRWLAKAQAMDHSATSRMALAVLAAAVLAAGMSMFFAADLTNKYVPLAQRTRDVTTGQGGTALAPDTLTAEDRALVHPADAPADFNARFHFVVPRSELIDAR
jgi:hypothetical protein